MPPVRGQSLDRGARDRIPTQNLASRIIGLGVADIQTPPRLGPALDAGRSYVGGPFALQAAVTGSRAWPP
jgi:hypothetical protein